MKRHGHRNVFDRAEYFATPMAFLVIPVAGGAIGGLTGVGLSWSYTQAANFSAAKVYGTNACTCR